MAELLAPAGSYDSLRAAVNAGADAVYIGGSQFGARAYADNPGESQLIRGIEFCHLRGRKLYLTVNTLLKEKEMEDMLYDFLLPFYEHGVDGLIIQDFGVAAFVLEHFPGLEVHASTQMTVTGAEGARLLREAGFSRVVPARELSLQEIRRIIEETGMEVETFVHGAMCYSYSGQCLFSSLLGGRSGNRGRCAQPCRLPYRLAGTDRTPSCLLSMKDMCALELLPELLDAGIASLKIEGRMKRPEYTAGVVSIYRKYIDRYIARGRKAFQVEEEDRRILLDLYNRGGFSQGYYHQRNGKTMMAMDRPNHTGTRGAKITGPGRGKSRAVALEDLGRKDILELAPGVEWSVQEDVKAGREFTVKTPPAGLKAGAILLRTRNEALNRRLQKSCLEENCKVNIKGELMISSGNPVILKLSCGPVSVTSSGDAAEIARSHPMSREAVEHQLRKTGNTEFIFETLDIRMEDGVFVPVKSLNELRRSGLSLLEQALLDQKRRKRPENQAFHTEGYEAREKREGGCRLNVLVTDRGQLESVLRCSDSCEAAALDTVYLDLLLFTSPEAPEEILPDGHTVFAALRERGLKCFLNLPPVLREKDRSLLEKREMQALMGEMDGFLLHTIDELAYLRSFLKQTGGRALLVSDETFYACNRRAAGFLRKEGVGRITFPAELNARELAAIGLSEGELPVYGYQPLMQSAQCVVKNTAGCRKKPAVTWIRDRKNVEFPVLSRCSVCCNTIYNSLPLELSGCRREIERLAPAFLRLSFTIESPEETERVLRKYLRALFWKEDTDEPDQEGTRGHFRRGVE